MVLTEKVVAHFGGTKAVADRVGVEPGTVRKWKRGERCPKPHSLEVLMELAEEMNDDGHERSEGEPPPLLSDQMVLLARRAETPEARARAVEAALAFALMPDWLQVAGLGKVVQAEQVAPAIMATRRARGLDAA